DEAAVTPSNEQTDTVAAAPVGPESTGALPPAPETAASEAAPASEEVAAAAPLSPRDEEGASEDAGVMPETAPIAPLRPADQPIDVVGEVKPDQVAAATTAAPDGNWAMQIASQPSEA